VAKEADLDNLEAEKHQLAEGEEMYFIVAPVDGTVIGLVGLTVGSYVRAAQELGEISPSDDLLVEAYVFSTDIGQLYVGQPVNCQIDAYPYTEWGLLPGKVKRVSGDYVLLPNQQVVFKVIVQPLKSQLQLRDGTTGEIKKGMAANCRFFASRHTILELLYESVNKLLDPATGKRPK